MRKYKTIMELIFIFILPLILILSSINIKEEQITTQSGYEWNTYIQYENKILVEMGEYKNIIQNFNIWNEETEIGSINTTTGQNDTPNDRLRSKGYIEVDPTKIYYFKSPSLYRIYTYDTNYTYITNTTWLSQNIFTLSSNTKYIRFVLSNSYGTTYKNNICINESVSWANGNYAPYGKPLIIYDEQDLSGQNDRTYTSFGAIKNLIIDNLKIQQNTTTDILFDYTILWFLMFILWHVLYLFFDMLIHLFIDWGHKEKEKTNG